MPPASPKQRPAAAASLRRLLKSEDPEVRKVAIEALGRTGGKACRLLLAETNRRGRKDVQHGSGSAGERMT